VVGSQSQALVDGGRTVEGAGFWGGIYVPPTTKTFARPVPGSLISPQAWYDTLANGASPSSCQV
jgi:hypothetical protein